MKTGAARGAIVEQPEGARVWLGETLGSDTVEASEAGTTEKKA